MPDLFPDAHCESPRLRWLRSWNVRVRKDGGSRFIAEIDEDLQDAGDTEAEAIEDLITTCGFPHWKAPIL